MVRKGASKSQNPHSYPQHPFIYIQYQDFYFLALQKVRTHTTTNKTPLNPHLNQKYHHTPLNFRDLAFLLTPTKPSYTKDIMAITYVNINFWSP